MRCPKRPCALRSQALYLDPLAALVCDNGGWVYPQGQFLGVCKSPTLMIDVKEISGQSAEASYGMIHAVLEQYAGALGARCSS